MSKKLLRNCSHLNDKRLLQKYANITVKSGEVTKRANEALANYVDIGDINLNNLIDGSRIYQMAAYNMIAIQDLLTY